MSYSEKDLANALLELAQAQREKEELSEEEKGKRAKKAAYALNVCTVSVSQIIDYDDINVLEQEYEAILNNLNLQQMPKDQALLNILNHLLDTITFFRIQEGDKRYIDRRYQHNIRNAIWEAVPTLAIFTMWSDPLGIATTVGLSYMNYRRRKADYILERDFQNWELERAAIDQLNNLQRELFDTSWRLADAYEFPEKFRLTERQIKQYNKILTDTDPVRRYERLESITDSFDAYPPYWYYLGHAAMEIVAEDMHGHRRLNNDQKKEFIGKAQKAFDQLLNDELYNILREDPIVSACALEYIDTLDAKKDKEKIEELIKIALGMSGCAYDIWELCSLAYLRINRIEEACGLLRRLVNEDYNTEINAQLLSSLYMKMYVWSGYNGALENYKLLASRSIDYYLFPVPKERTPEAYAESQNDFVRLKRKGIKERYGLALIDFINRSRQEFDKLYKMYFSDTSPNQEDVVVFFNRILTVLYQLPGVSPMVQDEVLSLVSMNLDGQKDKFSPDPEKGGQIDKNLFGKIMDPVFSYIGYSIAAYIEMADNLSDLSEAEKGLSKFCQAAELKEPEIIRQKEMELTDGKLLDSSVFGELSEEKITEKERYKKIKEMIQKYLNKVLKENAENTKLVINSDENRRYFEKYFNDWVFSFNAYRAIKRETVAILVDEKSHNDIIITSWGIRRRIGHIPKITKNVRFGEIDWGKKGRDEILLGNLESSINIPYRNDDVKMEVLLELFQKLAVFAKDVYEQIDISNPIPMLINVY